MKKQKQESDSILANWKNNFFQHKHKSVHQRSLSLNRGTRGQWGSSRGTEFGGDMWWQRGQCQCPASAMGNKLSCSCAPLIRKAYRYEDSPWQTSRRRDGHLLRWDFSNREIVNTEDLSSAHCCIESWAWIFELDMYFNRISEVKQYTYFYLPK